MPVVCLWKMQAGLLQMRYYITLPVAGQVNTLLGREEMNRIFIEDIREGNRVTGQFLVQVKQAQTTKSGKPFISLRLQDKTGSISAKIWDNADKLLSVFSKGDIINIDAVVDEYNQELQLNIRQLQKLPLEKINLEDFLPVTGYDIDEMFAHIKAFAESIENKHLNLLLSSILADPVIVEGLKKLPAAREMHHAYIGGLIEHTLSVARICDYLSGHYDTVSRDLLITGAILHDIGKIREFEYVPFIKYTDAGRLIGHLVMGVEMINEKVSGINGFGDDLKLQLGHLILSHHGELEFASPKLPQFAEAMILHQADDLDAKVNSIQRYIISDSNDDSDWTSFHKILGRYLYKKTLSSPMEE